ncbi:unnamed protein product, partial [Ectocarpus sp. 13 AM-2016]
MRSTGRHVASTPVSRNMRTEDLSMKVARRPGHCEQDPDALRPCTQATRSIPPPDQKQPTRERPTSKLVVAAGDNATAHGTAAAGERRHSPVVVCGRQHPSCRDPRDGFEQVSVRRRACRQQPVRDPVREGPDVGHALQGLRHRPETACATFETPLLDRAGVGGGEGSGFPKGFRGDVVDLEDRRLRPRHAVAATTTAAAFAPRGARGKQPPPGAADVAAVLQDERAAVVQEPAPAAVAVRVDRLDARQWAGLLLLLLLLLFLLHGG